MKAAIRASKTKNELYDNVADTLLTVVALGYDYNQVLDWNLGAFFDIIKEIEKMQKAKAGIL